MTEQKDLEEIVASSSAAGSGQSNGNNQQNSRIKNYLVDTAASWLYWTPIMTATGYFSGMETPEIIKSRLTSMAIATVVARPHGIFRKFWSEQWNTNTESSWVRKWVTDTTATWCFQVPLYSLQLYSSGTSFREGITAFGVGLVTSAVLGRPYGYFQDSWRKWWGTKPVF